MSEKWYLATLTTEKENQLRDIMNRGNHGAWKRRRAQALLCAYEGCTDAMTAERNRHTAPVGGSPAAAACRGRV